MPSTILNTTPTGSRYFDVNTYLDMLDKVTPDTFDNETEHKSSFYSFD